MVDWVKDSVSKGYALPYANYRIYTGRTTSTKVLNSTQISNNSIRSSGFHHNETQLSAIEFSIAETTLAKLTPMKSAQEKFAGKNYKETLGSIDISLAKKAKGCLDGCSVNKVRKTI